MSVQPYRTTAIFDEASLPAALRNRHSTKEGVWGIIRVLEGRVKLTCLDPASELVLDPGTAGHINPQQPHFVEPLGPMKMQVEFFDRPPDG